MKANGVVPDVHYPYRANKSDCLPNSKIIVFPLIKETFEYRLNNNENIMKNIVANVGTYVEFRKILKTNFKSISLGPVVVSLLANKNFKNYKAGVFEDFSCAVDCSDTNHAVLLAGN